MYLDFGFHVVHFSCLGRFRLSSTGGGKRELKFCNLPNAGVLNDGISDNQVHSVKTREVEEIFGFRSEIQVEFIGIVDVRFSNEKDLLLGLAMC